MNITNKLFNLINKYSFDINIGKWDKCKSPIICKKQFGSEFVKLEANIQIDKYWTKNGGKVCVNIFVDDLVYRKLPHVDITLIYLGCVRLSKIIRGCDYWHDINDDVIEQSARQIVVEIKEHLTPMFDKIKMPIDLLTIEKYLDIPFPMFYHFDIGNYEKGCELVVNSLKNRRMDDYFLDNLERVNLIKSNEREKLKLIQIQSRSDQEKMIADFIAEKINLGTCERGPTR